MLERARSAAVIGAGMTGLTVADKLTSAGWNVSVFEKGRARGGRISTRRTPRGFFDHGAPEIDARGEDFRRFLNTLGAVGDAHGRLFGKPGMRSIFDPLGEAVTIRQATEIAGLKRESPGWVLRRRDGREFAHYDHVIVTIPAPQAADLVRSVDPSLAYEVSAVRMQPVWTCMVEFETPVDCPDMSENGPVLRADRMGGKPGRTDDRNAWVIHMKPEFAEATINVDPELMAPQILEAFAETCGMELPGVIYLSAHRWRFAFADQPLGRPYLMSSHQDLLVGGDWTLGRRAEDGFDSGRAMAHSILSQELAYR
ncbi:NAD(P)-binding protein [Alphaproteobacteria bacterium GH1-50]|uniref:NAD(P)-binding protein n=1 Tax=Kangsaoukella pontilimi TaxID=2691042 RepID=A0A7C9MVF4_9RHOB|nr:FAD-dependent oxidoreductase [Kangsaoukella pontilimi]MXQ06794.1 NAD(P)-binding protein [Kangsaoukella pontilimi]